MNEHLNRVPARVIFWGGTGQAKVLRPIIEYYGGRVVAVFDDNPDLSPPFPDVPLYRGEVDFTQWITGQSREGLGFCIAIGNPHGRVRVRLHEMLQREGLLPVTVAHPSAWVEKNTIIGEGAQILAGAIICAEVNLGRQCIINTNASVDHECLLEDGVEVAPGATLCGIVHAETNSWICAGATILPRIRIGADAIVGAGAVVIRDVPNGARVVGVPAKRYLKR